MMILLAGRLCWLAACVCIHSDLYICIFYPSIHASICLPAYIYMYACDIVSWS